MRRPHAMNRQGGVTQMNWNVQPVRRMADLDLALCVRANRACVYGPVRSCFAVISWLGNGKFWYVLMLLLPVFGGREGLAVSLRMAAAGAVGILVYKLIKHLTHRPRPYMAHDMILLGAPALDQFSFPSGHTLHAVMFTVLVVAAFPLLGWLLLPFTALVAASRVILGLHYPTDVLLGALLGLGIALLAPAIPVP